MSGDCGPCDSSMLSNGLGNNTRLSRISMESSVELNERGFMNFYRENKNNSSFINMSNTITNEFFVENNILN